MSRSTLSGLARNKLRSISKSNRKKKLKKWLNFLLPAEKYNNKAEFSSLTSSRQITKKFHRTINLKSKVCLKIARLKMDTLRPQRGSFRRNHGLEIWTTWRGAKKAKTAVWNSDSRKNWLDKRRSLKDSCAKKRLTRWSTFQSEKSTQSRSKWCGLLSKQSTAALFATRSALNRRFFIAKLIAHVNRLRENSSKKWRETTWQCVNWSKMLALTRKMLLTDASGPERNSFSSGCSSQWTGISGVAFAVEKSMICCVITRKMTSSTSKSETVRS